MRLERSMGGAASWDTRVDECLARRFAAAPRARSYYLDLWADHQASGLAGAHFVSEVCEFQRKAAGHSNLIAATVPI